MNLLKTLQPITFHRAFVDLTGTINAALMLSQALYWTNHLKPNRDGWFYKTREDWQAETGLTRKEQDNARQRLTRLGILETRRAKVFADDCMTATWWRIDLNRLQAALDAQDQLPLRGDQLSERGNPTPYYPSNTITTTTTARDFRNTLIVAGEQQLSPGKSAREPRVDQDYPQPIPPDWQPQPATLQQLQREGMTADFIASVREEFLLFWLTRGDAKAHWDAAFYRQCRNEHAYRQTQETRHERPARRQRPAERPTQQPGRQRKPTMHERNERYRQFIEEENYREREFDREKLSNREDAYDAIPGEFVRH